MTDTTKVYAGGRGKCAPTHAIGNPVIVLEPN
jgi:hypothetical protein